MESPYEHIEEAALDMAIQGYFGVWIQAFSEICFAEELYDHLSAEQKEAAYIWAKQEFQERIVTHTP